MADEQKVPNLWVYFLAVRPGFLTASAAPVLVGSALGFAVGGSFSFGLFFLALAAIVFFHAGANAANNYYDYLSGNDRADKKTTPFSGGSLLIHKGLMLPKQMLGESLILLAAGALPGIIIVILTGSLFILALGVIGLAGGFFYTAGPLKLCYRTCGEVAIGILFGVLPVTGAYYLQTTMVDWYVISPAVIVSLLTFLVILVNEFPDALRDAAADKKTLVVRFGIPVCVVLYRTALSVTYVTALVSLFTNGVMVYGGAAYLLTLPLGIYLFKLVNSKRPPSSKDFRANAGTVGLHITGSLSLTIGFIVAGLAGGGA